MNATQTGIASSGISRRIFLGGVAAATGTLALTSCAAGSAISGGSSSQTLSILVLGASDQTLKYLTKTLAPAFADSTGMKLNIQSSDWASGFQKVTTAAASGTLTDLVMLGGIWTAPLASKHALLSLDNYLKGYGDKSKFFQPMLEDGAYDGHTYALPLYSDTRTTVYRKSYLEEAGIDPSKLPETWDDYTDAVQKMSKSNGGSVEFPADWGIDKGVGLQQTFAQLMLQVGGSYYDSSGKARFSSPQGVAALEYMMSFYRRKLASIDMVNSGTGPAPIVNGDAGATFSGFGAIQNARQFKPEAEDDILVGLPLAAESGKDRITSAWINKIGISARTKNRDSAWELLQFIFQPDHAAKLAELYGGLPARKDVVNAPYLKGLSPNLTAAAKYVKPQPPSPNMLAIAPQINTALQQAIRLQGSAASILTALDLRINEINGV